MTKLSQCRRILVHLRKAPITTWDAFTYLGCTRLSARIWDLRQAGNSISSFPKRVKNRRGEWVWVTQYKLHHEATNINVRKAA